MHMQLTFAHAQTEPGTKPELHVPAASKRVWQSAAACQLLVDHDCPQTALETYDQRVCSTSTRQCRFVLRICSWLAWIANMLLLELAHQAVAQDLPQLQRTKHKREQL
eukprot:10573-Heterococcus_DN1.PRE.1